MMVGLIWTIWKTQGDTLKEIHICFVLFMKNAQKQYSDTLKMGVQLCDLGIEKCCLPAELIMQ